MDVDLGPSEVSDMPDVDESTAFDDSVSPKDRVLCLLDKVEAAVERLRRDALKLEEEKDSLFNTLDTVRNSNVIASLTENDRDDIMRFAERVCNRCLTVEITVKTNRDQIQEDALHQVNLLIDTLVVNLKGDPSGTKVKCMSYMAACSSIPQQDLYDKNFESAILGCTLDDQKRIRKRLHGLLEYINREPKFSGIEDVMP